MLPTHDTNHVAEGLAMLLGQYRGKPTIAALVTAILTRVQNVEDVFWGVLESQLLARTFPAGTGPGEEDGAPDQALLQVADLVGAPVGTWTTRELALLVRIWILAHRSEGRAADLRTLLATAFGSFQSGAVAYADFPPAAFEAWAFDVADANLVTPVAEALTLARPPGVYGVLAWSDWPIAETFYFGDSSPGGAAGSGLKDSVDGGTDAGLLSGMGV